MTLPQGWVETTLSEIVTFNPKHDPATDLDQLVSFVPMPAVDEHSGTITSAIDRPLREIWGGFPHFADGDVIFAKITPCMENGKSAIARNLKNGLACGSTEFFVLRSSEGVQASYIWRYLRQRRFRASAETQMTGAVGQRRVPRAYLESYLFRLPPAGEQRRIVAKLDTLTARLARTRKELERVVALGAKLRQSILARAFSGELTAAWRKQEGYADVDWQTCSLSEIADVQGGIQVGKKRSADAVLVEVPYLRVANVQRGWLRLNEIKTLAVTAEERDRLLLEDGDILMNEGGDRDKLGRGWVWREEMPGCIHQNHVFRVRLKDQGFPPEFVSHYANEFGQAYFIDQGTQTTNLASISKRRVMALPVPVPPAAEAREIVRLITAAFARADRLEAEAARARALLDRLEAAVLAKAFRGELVPQDPNDEPASVLLDRIRAERAAAPKPKRGRARKAVG